MRFFAWIPVIAVLSFANAVDIKVTNVDTCETPIDNDLCSIDLSYNDGEGCVNMEMTLNYDLTGDDDFIVLLHQISADGSLKHNVSDVDGTIEDYVNQFMADAWPKVRDIAEPAIEEEFYIPAGTYKYDCIKVAQTDIRAPGASPGLFKVETLTFTEDYEPACCFALKVEVKA